MCIFKHVKDVTEDFVDNAKDTALEQINMPVSSFLWWQETILVPFSKMNWRGGSKEYLLLLQTALVQFPEPYDGLQPPITSVLGIPMSPSDFHEYRAHYNSHVCL